MTRRSPLTTQHLERDARLAAYPDPAAPSDPAKAADLVEAFGPLEIEDWRCREFAEMDEKALRFLGATDYVICNYFRGETREAAQPAPCLGCVTFRLLDRRAVLPGASFDA